MQHVLQAQSSIYAQFHGSSASSVNGPQGDDFAAYYTSMYLIQDTGEAVHQDMAGDFPADPLRAYVEFWGVMQAIFIQQDAISKLHRVIVGTKPTIDQILLGPDCGTFGISAQANPASRTIGVPACSSADVHGPVVWRVSSISWVGLARWYPPVASLTQQPSRFVPVLSVFSRAPFDPLGSDKRPGVP
jgi:hypothetical protein